MTIKIKKISFPKSGGYEDLIESYYNKKNNDITLFIAKNILKKIIFCVF